MNNKYSVACITLVRDKYTVRLHGAPCSSLDGVTACVVYTADSIRTQKKNDSQVPNFHIMTLHTCASVNKV